MHVFMTKYAFYSFGERKVKLITLYLPEPYLEALDELVSKRYYPHRAEAIRVAIRDLVSSELWGREKDAKDS
jgi:Arc/MetJ-type ribon-helix-helix transcriptional regulator